MHFFNHTNKRIRYGSSFDGDWSRFAYIVIHVGALLLKEIGSTSNAVINFGLG